jgi:hypothetical protein
LTENYLLILNLKQNKKFPPFEFGSFGGGKIQKKIHFFKLFLSSKMTQKTSKIPLKKPWT